MKSAFLIAALAFVLSANAQEYDVWKNGNNTFRLNLKSIQSYFTSPHTVKQFEKTLGKYERYMPLPESVENGTAHFNLMLKNEKIVGISVEFDTATNIINKFSYILIEDEIAQEKFVKFKNELKALGYVKDIRLTRVDAAIRRHLCSNCDEADIYRHLFFTRRNPNILVNVFIVEDDYRYDITISK